MNTLQEALARAERTKARLEDAAKRGNSIVIQPVEYDVMALAEAYLDAARDTESAEARIVSDVVGFLNERIDEVSTHIKDVRGKGVIYRISAATLQSARDGLVASYDLNKHLRSVAAPERVCRWTDSAATYGTSCGRQFDCQAWDDLWLGGDQPMNCPGCGRPISTKE